MSIRGHSSITFEISIKDFPPPHRSEQFGFSKILISIIGVKMKLVMKKKEVDSAIQFPTLRFYGLWSSQRPFAKIGLN